MRGTDRPSPCPLPKRGEGTAVRPARHRRRRRRTIGLSHPANLLEEGHHGRDPGARPHALSAARRPRREHGPHPQARHGGPRPAGPASPARGMAGADAPGVGRRPGAHRGEGASSGAARGFQKARRALDDVRAGRRGDLGRRPVRELPRGRASPPSACSPTSRSSTVPWRRTRAAPNVWGEARRHRVRVQGPPARRERISPPASSRRASTSAYAYRPAAPSAGPRVHEHAAVPRLRPARLPLPGRPVPRELLRPAVIAQRGERGPLRQPAGRGPPRPAVARSAALLRPRQAAARVLAGSPWRVALIASSSWSHAFLTPKHHLPLPGRRRPTARSTSSSEPATTRPGGGRRSRDIEESGQHEMLNWMCLAGAMEELGRRRPDESTLIQTYIFNSSKCFTVSRP